MADLKQLAEQIVGLTLLEAQELNARGSTGVTYWEGACDVSGSFGETPVRGQAYVEMTGYDRAFRAP